MAAQKRRPGTATPPADPGDDSKGTSKQSILIISILFVLGGCALNNIALEFLIKEDLIPYAYKSSGSLITVLQYGFIVVMTASSALQPLYFPQILKPRTIPLKHYALMASIAGLASWLNNISFAYNISQPTHMVFRSSGLVISFIIGYCIFSKPYTVKQGLAVLAVTLGAVLTTYAEMTEGDTAKKSEAANSSSPDSCPSCGGPGSTTPAWSFIDSLTSFRIVQDLWNALTTNSNDENGSRYFLVWCIGMCILTSVIFLHTMLGQIQNKIYNIYGKNPQENLFYTHLIPLVGYFAMFYNEIPKVVGKWNESPTVAEVVGSADTPDTAGTIIYLLSFGNMIPGIEYVPVMWWFAAWNVVTQYICLSGVFRLFSHADALTATLVMTVRKCLSLLLSVKLFDNTFTDLHWIGASLVFSAALYYSTTPSATSNSGKKKNE
eukprot:gb/GECG01006703.1/.p1 GENE.gb/GECG01006703.1/~~gb/GECG01006703.1/.p1  ORF type:complete len:436 (+),score=25.59 gb/GECG01006703.1/:1-1308(+)